MMAAQKHEDAEDPPAQPAGDTRRQAAARSHRPPMAFRITLDRDFLQADLAHRETVEEMRDFLRAVVRNSARCATILIRVRASKPLFHVERDGLIGYFRKIARTPLHRVALLADTPDLHAAHEYLELIARQHGVRVRAFRTEAEAMQWLKDRRYLADRRRSDELHEAQERRCGEDRRQGPRRTGSGA